MNARRRGSLALAATILLSISTPPALEAQEAEALAAVVTIDETIDGFTARALEVRVRESLDKKPRFLIVRLDTPGGTVAASDEIATNLQRLSDQGITTIAYVVKKALSGGTLVALACDRIVMGPGTQIGDVLPISLRRGRFGEMLDPRVAEKIISPMRATLESYAEPKGYPLPLIRAMVDPQHSGIVRIELAVGRKSIVRYISQGEFDALPPGDREAIIEHEVIVEPGKLVTLGETRALEAGIAWKAGIKDVKELCRELALEHKLERVEPFAVSNLWWLGVLRICVNPWVKGLLFAIGAIALFIGLSSPGMAVPEVIAVLAFGLAFGSSYFVGMASYIELLVFLVGVALILTEIFVIPGFGVTGILGILCIMASFMLTLQTFVLPTTSAEWSLFVGNIMRTLVSFAVIAVAIAITLRFVPASKLFRGLIHTESQQAGAAAVLAGTQESMELLTGKRGVVHTPLRPAGEIRLGDDVLDAVSEESHIEVGTEVEVIGRRGFSVLVRSVPKGLGYEADGPLGKRLAEKAAEERGAAEEADS